MRFRLITPDQLDEALREQRETGRDVGAIVVERGWINEDQLARLLSYAPAFPGESEPASTPLEPEVEQSEAEREPEHAAVSAPESSMEVDAEVEAEVDTELESQREPEPEPDVPSAGPVISARTQASEETSAAPAHPWVAHVPPALELIDPELSADSESADAPTEVAESTPVAEHSVALVPIAPIVSAPEPVVADEPVAVEPVVEAEPVVEPEPVAVEPATAAEIASEPVAVEPEPVAEIVPEPVSVATEPMAEIVPEPVSVATEPQTVTFVEPAAMETIARVFVRLSNGERVEAGSFDDIAAAKARADEVVRQVSNGNEGWPFFAGRYIRPEAIVSVDVDATVVRYA